MVEKSQDPAAEGENAASAASAPPTPPARRPGHRGMDPRETLAELTAKAHEISQHAGTKVGAAMKDVIGAAAGLTGFAVESARDLIQYMVRRGQMTQMEGDKLLREVEAAHPTKRAATRSLEDSARTSSQRTPSPVSSFKAPAAKPAAKPAQKPASKPEAAPVKAAKGEAAPAKTASKPETAATKEDRTPKSSIKAAAKKAPAVQVAPAARKSATAPAEKPAATKATKDAAKAPKAAAKKSTAKGSASRAAAPSRPKAAAKSSPIRRKK